MIKFKADVRDRLLALMDEAGIPRNEFDATTIGELALRLERRALAVHAECIACGARYSLAEFTYLHSTGFWHDDGERLRPGAKPELEGRLCRCGTEMRVDAHEGASASVPLYENGQ
jgi:hypothetical protein